MKLPLANQAVIPRCAVSRCEQQAQRVQRLLTKKVEGGKTVEVQMAEHLAKTVLECGPDNVVGAAKAFETLEARAWGKVRENEDTLDALHRANVKVVIVQMPENLQPMPALPAPAHQTFFCGS